MTYFREQLKRHYEDGNSKVPPPDGDLRPKNKQGQLPRFQFQRARHLFHETIVGSIYKTYRGEYCLETNQRSPKPPT